MLWSRAKTILIGYLLLVNLILGVLLLHRAWEDRRGAMAGNASLQLVLEGFGFAVEEDVLPPGNQRLRAYEIRIGDGDAARYAGLAVSRLEDLLALMEQPGEVTALPGCQGGLNAATSLIRYVTALYGSSPPGRRITAVEPGYAVSAVTSEVLLLTPVWRVTIDGAVITLNAVTSQAEAAAH
jgi:hypothetical protein